LESNLTVEGEIYVAPLYNYLIQNGFDIRYILLKDNVTLHSGVPEDYEALKNILNNE
jgi:hypothetical protein